MLTVVPRNCPPYMRSDDLSNRLAAGRSSIHTIERSHDPYGTNVHSFARPVRAFHRAHAHSEQSDRPSYSLASSLAVMQTTAHSRLRTGVRSDYHRSAGEVQPRRPMRGA